MNYDILETLIKLTQNPKETIQMFMDEPTLLTNYRYQKDSSFYLNDSVIAIRKSTLSVDAIGVVVNISKTNELCICKRGNKSCLFIRPEKYHLFIRQTKSRNNDRIFYEKLLQTI